MVALKDINWALTENNEFLPFIFNADKTKIKLLLTNEVIVLKQYLHWVMENIQKSTGIKIKDIYYSEGYYTQNMALRLYYDQLVMKSFAAKSRTE